MDATVISKYLWTIFLFCSLLIVYLGSKRKVVIFYDWKDVLVTFSIVAVPLFGVLFARFVLTSNSEAMLFFKQRILVTGLISVSAIMFFANFAYAIRFNGNPIVGVLIGAYKLLFALVIFVGILSLLKRGQPQEHHHLTPTQNLVQNAFLALLLGVVAWFVNSIVNGREVFTYRAAVANNNN